MLFRAVLQELPALLASHFPQLDTGNASITGHSMGGHGALTIALKNPGMFKSLSAFAPICNPCIVPWGTKAFTGYFGKSHDCIACVQRRELHRTEGPRVVIEPKCNCTNLQPLQRTLGHQSIHWLLGKFHDCSAAMPLHGHVLSYCYGMVPEALI